MLFERKKPLDIDAGIEEFRRTEDALLVDVREADEYAESFIVGSINLPLTEIDKAEDILKKKDQPIFVYCRSGNRSGKAETRLKEMGYTKVKNIGGIMYASKEYIRENER